MARRDCYLGIDIGSVSIALAMVDGKSNVIHTEYGFHGGRLTECLSDLLGNINVGSICAIGYTSSTPAILSKGKMTDTRIAYISAAKHFHPDLQALLIIGAEKFGLATFGPDGEYLNYRSNTSCAAGTGNFLDQQVERLNLKSIQEFCETAYENRGSFPLIASRCAVFAKTDLIHAQQEGYTLREICDGLTYGLARNIIDAVSPGDSIRSMVAAGGVALNKAVIGHIEKSTGISVIVDPYAPVYGAIGAALNCREDGVRPLAGPLHFEDILTSQKKEKKYAYPPLQLLLSSYPDFTSAERYEFRSQLFPAMKPVEADLYIYPQNHENIEVFLGIDIGSTSTKAVLLDTGGEVMAGFYTRTAGQPLQAVMVIFEAICNLETTRNWHFFIKSAGTTGSGRKFTGKILGADIILDEISAHAKAAFKLDPEIDTIIEIGGQDSKFTLMQQGVVTFSVMNNVCAAGTGSFIEELAKKLACSLDEYSARAEKVCSPMTSDRCTVYMERDLNHFLNTGYTVDEILAAVLHATRDNYLSKVAISGKIGSKVTFQGATAKNRALVAAFEQKLQKPVMVSKFCHLTGALGVAIELFEQNISVSSFRGLDLYKKQIPVQSETCQLCTNHCKLKVAEIDHEVVAYGFLCGRDYQEKKYVRIKSLDFQLIRKRRELFEQGSMPVRNSITIGIPAGLHLYEEIPFWRKFFELLGISTVTSEDCRSVVKDGKNLSGAEFCAPMAAMHAHVDYLLQRSDFVFLPTYLSDNLANKVNKQYCYYTQYISPVVSAQKHFEPRERILNPLLKSSQGELHTRLELYKMLKNIGIKDAGFLQITRAFEKARIYCQALEGKWKALYQQETQDREDIHIMLLGRPYTVLSPAMNNHIPEIIEKYGIRTYYMDMLPNHQHEGSLSDELISVIRWKFAAGILHAAETVARTRACYPVLLTSFKCTPDSFVVEYFKEICLAHRKPYLILQLDEHDSTVGYETRIEAAIRAFRNHFSVDKPGTANKQVAQHSIAGQSLHDTTTDQGNKWEIHIRSLLHDAQEILLSNGIDLSKLGKVLGRSDANVHYKNISGSSGISGIKNKTLLLPSWDQQVGPLLEAVLQNSGLDARLVTGTHESIRKSLVYNTGQCIPLNIIVQNAIDYIEANRLAPEKTVLWIIKSNLSCNLSMFPQYMKKLLKDYGKGLEQASVYAGDLIFYDISLKTAINAYLAYMFGGYIRKIGCTIRPYELSPGTTNRVIQESFALLQDAFRKGGPKEAVLQHIVTEFEAIPTLRTGRAKVAIFGDLYVRDNELMNQNLIKTIEDNGGEAITTPYSDYIKLIVDPFAERALREGRYIDYARTKFLKSLIPLVEEKYLRYFGRLTGTAFSGNGDAFDNWLNKFGVNLMHRGESFENIMKIYKLVQEYPDLSLFIQTNPSYCCPSLITEAMSPRIEEVTGIPVVTIEYDGTSGYKNEDIIPYLKFRKNRQAG
jgi:predicted CoA-substrate-specific enzyme activase